jgi:hypothetical protein
MTGDGCAATGHDFAVYLFGALSPTERAAVDSHLASCRRCREELALLAGLPALLQKVPAAQATRICDEQTSAEGPDPFAASGLLNTMLSRTARARRHQRWRLAAAALVLIAAAAAGWGPRILHHAQHRVPPRHWWATTVAGFNPKTEAGAWVRYAARAWGTELEVHVTGIPTGTACQWWVIGSHGHEVEAGGWVIAPGQQASWYPASTSVRPASLHGFEVTSAGKILVIVQAHR